jgi:hypothetical protein
VNVQDPRHHARNLLLDLVDLPVQGGWLETASLLRHLTPLAGQTWAETAHTIQDIETRV